MPKKIIEVDPSEFDQLMYILAYDVPSENIKSLTHDERVFLNSKRWFIRDQLRFKYGCAMLQKSLYRVPDTAVEAVKVAVDKWREEYNERNYEAKLRVFPIGTTEEGYQAFSDMEHDCIMAWLTDIEASLQDAIDKKTIQQKALREHKDKVRVLGNIIEQDFGKSNANYDLKKYKALKEELSFVEDSIGTVESVAKIKKYY